MEEKYIDLVSSVADILQIGSRNMQNYPFLTACAKTQKPIMLKRHYGSSLRDWLGAAEYILYEGNTKVILCERGVSVPHTHRSTSRYSIDLQVVPAAKEVTPSNSSRSFACNLLAILGFSNVFGSCGKWSRRDNAGSSSRSN